MPELTDYRLLVGLRELHGAITESHLDGKGHLAMALCRPGSSEITNTDYEWAHDFRDLFAEVHVPARPCLGPAYSPTVRDLRWAVAGLLVAATVLTGCAEKQEANTTLPTASAAPTAEALPQMGPADFPVPNEARTKDAAGAEAFLRYWIDLLNRQQAIPAGQPLRDLGPECTECLRIARAYDESAAAGRRYVGGTLAVVDAASTPIDGDTATVVFLASEEAVQLVDASGTPVQSVEGASDLSSGITLAWSDAKRGWLVSSMTLG